MSGLSNPTRPLENQGSLENQDSQGRLSCCGAVCRENQFEGRERSLLCSGCCLLSQRVALLLFAQPVRVGATRARPLPARDNGETFWVSQESRVRSPVAQTFFGSFGFEISA